MATHSGISDDPTTWIMPRLGEADQDAFSWWQRLRREDDALHERVGPIDAQRAVCQMAGESSDLLNRLTQAVMRMRSGDTQASISEDLGLDCHVMAELARRVGVVVRPRGPHGNTDPEVRERAVQLMLAGLKAKDVCGQVEAEFGVQLKPYTLHQWMHRLRKQEAS